MKVLQINTSGNTAAPGKIAEEIGRLLIRHGHSSIIAYGRKHRPSQSNLRKIGNIGDVALHGLHTRVFDNHGFGSYKATCDFVRELKDIDPDIIHLHNIHGYYLNIGVLFEYLKTAGKPVVWTLHDCWPFTGHCSFYDFANCEKWKTECNHCPNKHAYPKSWFIDNSRKNFIRKREIFTGVPNLFLVAPSQWLVNQVKESFLSKYPISLINNGINLSVFRPALNLSEISYQQDLSGKFVIIGVANVWDRRKGFDDFIKLSSLLSHDESIVLVGLNKKQLLNLPQNIIGIERTDNVEQLACLYGLADVFVNPTYVDNFPTTNIEALACGTPVVSYNTGGSPEAISDETGFIVSKGDVNGLLQAIREIFSRGRGHYKNKCRQRAESNYDANILFKRYIDLYVEITSDALTF